jgi:hypothetical protein
MTSLLLRIAAVLSVLWAGALVFFVRPDAGRVDPPAVALAHGLAIANISFAFLLWRASGDPARERTALYTALILFGLRAANGTYDVLYLLHGPPAVLSLIDMIAALALFIGLLNSLPATLRGKE